MLTRTITDERQAPKRGAPREDFVRLATAAKGRRPMLAVGSVLLVAVSLVVFVSLYSSASDRSPVLEIARPVAALARISPGDLVSVRVNVPESLPVVPASDAREAIGERAAVPLVPGSLLTPSELVRTAALPPGQAIVGVSASPADVPAGGLSTGERVEVVLTGPPGSPYQPGGSPTAAGAPASYGSSGGSGASAMPGNSIGSAEVTGATAAGGGPSSAAGSVIAPNATVVGVASPSTQSGSNKSVVSLEVPSVLAPLVASASAAGEAALVLVGPS